MEWIKIALSLGEQVLKKIPNYDQKKKQEYFNKKKAFLEEITKEYPVRDDDLILNLREELLLHLESFNKEIKA